ncbi:Aste57867_10267 [Aphanomyces stellatus]|uniref:Aste57867_10267 protein n=1 Tax=Aphanomyces stellatus TaxID=120398 RepID=A0A485KQF7_9STRA|nr:hypothetical protein As57867_010227 [Aphanomyces stellatus]VFT87142.1 Aste57867_10267 [Aphanomyces stellatus]
MPMPMMLYMCFPKDKNSKASSSATGCGAATIGAPFAISHDLHITYNFELARFEIKGEGPHPPDLLAQLVGWNVHQHFKVPITQIPRVALPAYKERIPAVLLMLQHQLAAHNGLTVPYIFRESPGKADRDLAIEAINTGTFCGDDITDVRIVADLIKVWFRDLPTPLLHQIPLSIMEQLNESSSNNSDAAAVAIQSYMGVVELSILEWLADLLLDVAAYEVENHMGINQLAIILAPNLIRIDTPNPTVAVTLSKACVDFLRLFLQHRRGTSSPTSSSPQ